MVWEHGLEWWVVRLSLLAVFGTVLVCRRRSIKKNADMLLDPMWEAFWKNLHSDPKRAQNFDETQIGRWIFGRYTFNVTFVHYAIYLLTFCLSVGSLFGLWQTVIAQDVLTFIKTWHLPLAVVIFTVGVGLHELSYRSRLWQQYLDKKWEPEETAEDEEEKFFKEVPEATEAAE